MNRFLTAVLMCAVAVSTGIKAVQAQEGGASYEMYVNGGGWQKAVGIMSGNVSCGDPTVWDAYLVSKGNRE